MAEGKIAWDSRVADLLPEEVPQGCREELLPITLENLLCMGSGLEEESDSLPSDPGVTWARHVLSHRLAPACRDYCLYAGISSPVAGIREAHIAWLQAGAALEKAFRLRSERWTIPFSDCALEYLAAQVQPPMRLGHLVSPELLRLIEHDAAHGTPYFETLRTYLLQERDIPRTSQALIIHRTTLLYRLKRIEAIVGLNLNDPWTRLQLTLSLWILEQEGKR